MDRSDLGGGPGWSRTSGTRFRKPLLYPSELRGQRGATLVDRFTLRKAPLALSKLAPRSLATVLATVCGRLRRHGAGQSLPNSRARPPRIAEGLRSTRTAR